MQRAEVVASRAEVGPHAAVEADAAPDRLEMFAAARASDLAWRAARRVELERSLQRLNRAFMITFGSLAFLGPTLVNVSTMVVRAEHGFGRSAFQPVFIASLIGIGVVAVLAGCGVVGFVSRQRALQGELAALAAERLIVPPGFHQGRQQSRAARSRAE